MKKSYKALDGDTVRVIKISGEALFEFIYEKFIDDQETFFDVDPLSVSDTFSINYERGEFIFCVHKSEDAQGKSIEFPREIDLQKLMKAIPDTAATMFAGNRYRDYTRAELTALAKEQ